MLRREEDIHVTSNPRTAGDLDTAGAAPTMEPAP
jgi:hypothetical protein